MRTAVGYVRVSTTEQVHDGFGLAAQEETIRSYCEREGLRLVALYRDEGVSGALADREGLGDALADLEAGEAELLVVARLDRLARDLVIGETIIGRLQDTGRDVLSVAEPDLTDDDPTRTLIRHILGALAEYERAVIRARLAAGKRIKASQGGYVGGRPRYGTRAEEGELVPDTEELEVVELARGLRDEGASLRTICEALERAGHRPRRGRRWHPYVVSRMLERGCEGAA